jgi:hypothetical protein
VFVGDGSGEHGDWEYNIGLLTAVSLAQMVGSAATKIEHVYECKTRKTKSIRNLKSIKAKDDHLGHSCLKKKGNFLKSPHLFFYECLYNIMIVTRAFCMLQSVKQ